MRWLVWSFAGLLLSCTKSSSSDESGGSAAGHGGVAGAGAGAGAGGGTLSGSGGAPALGGRGGVPSAGSSAGDPPSGASGSAGHGEAGAGNEPDVECEGKYLECGCGCCVTDPPAQPGYASCYYPELGENLAAIQAADQAAAMSSACANVGCSGGIERLCCLAPEEAGPAVYEAVGYSGGLDQITITRTDDEQRCTRVHFEFPNLTPSEFPLHLPTNWLLRLALDCGGRTGTTRGIGAMGSLVFKSSDPCTVSFDFTVFLRSEVGEVEAVRFQSEAEVSGLHWCEVM